MNRHIQPFKCWLLGRSNKARFMSGIAAATTHTSRKGLRLSEMDLAGTPSSASASSTQLLQVSTPHPISNICLLRLSAHGRKTLPNDDIAWLQRRVDVQENHHIFWAANNTEFQSRMDSFTQLVLLRSDREPTTEELSIFYKSYLDDSRDRHAAYNALLWRDNFALLLPGIRADLRAAVRSSLNSIHCGRELFVDYKYFLWLYVKRQMTLAFSSNNGLYQAHGVTVR
ncbi:hypothetical protein BASA62_006194 [Batrachochytrium salamandrivorans]|nr:hypothetical protein BASA62_006194 [Batrachochytrium salamandrivorans]